MKQAGGPTEYIFVPYVYVAISGSIAAGAGAIVPLVLDMDYDFEMHYITGSTSADDVTDYRPNNFSVQISDKSNSRIWSNDRIPQVHLANAANNGLRETRPVMLSRRSNLSFDILSLSADALIATISLKGYKVIKVAGN